MEKIKLSFINFSRKHFRNTWIHRLPFTSKIYKKMFLSVYKDSKKQIEFRGNTYIVPTRDVTVVPAMISGDYEKFELDIFSKIAKGKKVIIDVGANIGVYSIEASRVSPKSKVLAFEPIPENIEVLSKNLELNNINNVEIVTSAAGDKKKTNKIFLANDSIGTHSMGKVSENFTLIQQETIDNIAIDKKVKIDLIKMDIEGYEPSAVKGALKTIKDDKPSLFIEFSANHLKRCGFDPSAHASNLLKLYKYAYLIDERQKSVRLIKDKESIETLLNVNLVLSAKPISF